MYILGEEVKLISVSILKIPFFRFYLYVHFLIILKYLYRNSVEEMKFLDNVVFKKITMTRVEMQHIKSVIRLIFVCGLESSYIYS